VSEHGPPGEREMSDTQQIVEAINSVAGAVILAAGLIVLSLGIATNVLKRDAK
jgi:hypothetical protein